MIDWESLQKEALGEEIKIRPQFQVRASGLGDECERRIYYSIANWKDRVPHGESLQSIFKVGSALEEHHAIPLINKMRGLRVVDHQASYAMESPNITMTIDGKVLVEEANQYVDEPVGSKIPIEIKTVTPWDWVKLNTIEDFVRSKKMHQRAYVTQIQLYLLGTGAEYGYLVTVNKVTGLLKFIKATIDLAFCDELLAKAERVYKALALKEPPSRIEDTDECMRCQFRQICLPTIKNEGVKIIDKNELSALLQERDALKPSVDRYTEVDGEIKESMKAEGTGEYVVGDFLVKVKEREKKQYVVPASKYLETRIVRMT